MRFWMDRSQVQFAVLKITLAVLAGTTWLFTSFVFSTKPSAAPESALTSIVRLPASIPSGIQENFFASSGRQTEPVRMDVVDVSCWDGLSPEEQPVKSRWVRLTGRSCLGGTRAEQIQVKNLSNGFEATIFPSGPQALTTDFIPLQEGKNEILIRFESEAGAAVENRMLFSRESRF